MSTAEMAAARAKIRQQIDALHKYHLDVKHKIALKEAEVRLLLKDMLTSRNAGTVNAGSAADDRIGRAPSRKSVGTSPHKCSLMSAPPSLCQGQQATGLAGLPVPSLRIKGCVPAKSSSVAAPGTDLPRMPDTDVNFILGATDSLSLMLTGEQRRWGHRQPLKSPAAPADASRLSAWDSLTLSPIQAVRPSEDLSLVSGGGTVDDSSVRAPQAFAVDQTSATPLSHGPVRPLPVLELKRVRFTSKSPQVDLFSVERAEPFSSHGGLENVEHREERTQAEEGEESPAPITGAPANRRGCHPTLSQRGCQPDSQASLSDSGEMDTLHQHATLRNSLREMLSTIESIRRSLSGSSQSKDTSTMEGHSGSLEKRSHPSRGSFKKNGEAHAAPPDSRNDSEDAATPSPVRKASRLDGEEEEAGCPATVAASSWQGRCGRARGESDAEVLPEGTTLSTVFLQRGRPHALPCAAKQSARVVPHTRRRGATERSVAVHLSSLPALQEASAVNMFGVESTLGAPLSRHCARKRNVRPHLSKRTALSTATQPVWGQRTKPTAARPMPADNRVFQRPPAFTRDDDKDEMASSAAISLAGGPTLYFD